MFEVREEIVYYDEASRRSWKEGGPWPHENHFGFYEAVVAAHFTMQGYQVVRRFTSTRPGDDRSVLGIYTKLFHAVVGDAVSAFFTHEIASMSAMAGGQPDLFVFREEHPNDPHIRYADPRLWFFVEAKGLGDAVRENQKLIWRKIAERVDIGLGPDRIRLFRVVPRGKPYAARVVRY